MFNKPIITNQSTEVALSVLIGGVEDVKINSLAPGIP